MLIFLTTENQEIIHCNLLTMYQLHIKIIHMDNSLNEDYII